MRTFDFTVIPAYRVNEGGARIERIPAIVIFRQVSGLDLRQSKDMIDRNWPNDGPIDAREYGEFLKCWNMRVTALARSVDSDGHEG